MTVNLGLGLWTVGPNTGESTVEQEKIKRKKHVPKEEVTNPSSFAHGINFYKLFWLFIIGSVIGFIVETLYCYAVEGFFESRKGIIYGPFTPIYGFGAVLFTLILQPIRKKNGLVIFAVSAISGAAFEYAASLFQEIAMGTTSWEYSNEALNLNGRTSIWFAACWGLLGFVYIRHIYPLMTTLIEKIPNRIGLIITWIMIVFMVFDIAISWIAVKRQTDRFHGIPADNAFLQFIDEHYDDDYLKQVYPNMQPAMWKQRP